MEIPLEISTLSSKALTGDGDGTQSESSTSPSCLSTDHARTQKKRRAPWGRDLPQPRTSIPPRRRARTAEEKEQRAIERVLRNRRSAHDSRERKRLELEALQGRIAELEQTLVVCIDMNAALVKHVEETRRAASIDIPQLPLAHAAQYSHLACAQDTAIVFGDNFQESQSSNSSAKVMGWLTRPDISDPVIEQFLETDMFTSVTNACPHLAPTEPPEFPNPGRLQMQGSENVTDSSTVDTCAYDHAGGILL